MNNSYIVIKKDDWNKLRNKIRRLNSDLLLPMDEMAKPIELDNHHNAALCPYCTPRPTIDDAGGGQWSRVGDTDYG